jgi:peptidyl-tRNA hydrolase, PTH1 family
VSENRAWIVAGLGNPGRRYATTRHNAGAMVVETLVEETGARFKSHKSGCLVAETSLAGTRATLARPVSYMNESGGPVGRLLRYLKLDPSRLVVIHDELDLRFGDVRVKEGGGTAGHNGLRSVVAHLGADDFVRVRVGIGRPLGERDPVDYVLSSFSAAERKSLQHLLEDAAAAVGRVVEVGAERAMNEVNTRRA